MRTFLALLTAFSLALPPLSAAPPKPAAPAKAPASVPPAAKKKTPAPAAKAPSLAQDLAHYRRMAAAKKMGANDRLYVLLRLKNKYDGAKVDMKPLLTEIDAWEKAARTGVPPPSAVAAAPAKPAAKKPVQAAAKPAAKPATPAAAATPSKTSAPAAIASAASTATPAADAPAASAAGGMPLPLIAVNLPVEEDTELRPGDALVIQVSPAKDLNREVVVQPDGTFAFPLLGAVRAAGMSPSRLQVDMTRRLSEYVLAPVVRVLRHHPADNAVFVMGRVKNPGGMPFREDLTVPLVIKAADGFLEDADREGILVHRGSETITVGMDEPFPLRAGDVLEVRAGHNATVSIMGMVAKPGPYPVRNGRTVLDLLTEAGGPICGARLNRIYLYRQGEEGRESAPINLERLMSGRPGEDPALRPGDIVMVPQKTPHLFGDTPTPWLALAALALAVVAVARH
jgi:protein involved in polysaccharide export with SLBB domain